MDKLKPCPCGKIPTNLLLCDNGQGNKWGDASGDCCGEWRIEFRSDYNSFDSKEAMDIAVRYWNEAPRHTPTNDQIDTILAMAESNEQKRERIMELMA